MEWWDGRPEGPADARSVFTLELGADDYVDLLQRIGLIYVAPALDGRLEVIEEDELD